MTEPKVHLIRYVALIAPGKTETGVAKVPTDLPGRPSWADCHRAIPGYVTGEYLCAEEPSASEKTGA